jgi:mRNA interferase RelE/StbE
MYKLKFNDKSLKEFEKLDNSVQKKIVEKLNLLKNGIEGNNNIKKLQGNNSLYRLRVSDYRIIFDKQENVLIITIVKVGHRREVYKKL